MEKNFIISDVADGTVEPVNVNNIFTFRKGPTALFGKVKYTIDFYKDGPQMDARPISWNYEKESERDCDYAKIVQLVAQSINEVVA